MGGKVLKWNSSSSFRESEDDDEQVIFEAGKKSIFEAEKQDTLINQQKSEDQKNITNENTEKHDYPVRVTVGWLKEQDESLRVSLGGLVASVALKMGKGQEPNSNDLEWFEKYLTKVVVQFIGLGKEIIPGIKPLGLLETDSKPLYLPWFDRATEEDRIKAFGELYAQSILEIGLENKEVGRFDSRSLMCLMRVARCLKIPIHIVESYDKLIAELVVSSADFSSQHELSEEEKAEKSKSNIRRRFTIGAAAVTGAVLIGVTGGLALPAIGAGIATFGGAAATTGAFVASTAGTALFTTLFTAGGLSLTGYRMSNRLGALKEFRFENVKHPDTQKQYKQGLHVVIYISGWYEKVKDLKKKKEDEIDKEKFSTVDNDGNANDDDKSDNSATKNNDDDSITQNNDEALEKEILEKEYNEIEREYEGVDEDDLATKNWKHIAKKNHGQFGEPYQLIWETEVLKKVSVALNSFAYDEAVSIAVQETLKQTALASLLAAITWPALLVSLSKYIDNTWAVACNRAKLAGEELGRAIVHGAQGHRPVTLVGYSLGGLVIYHCLDYMYKLKEQKKQKVKVDGLISNVILLGAPIAVNQESWKNIRSIVAGSIVNGYSSKDWILTVLFRASTASFTKIAGLYPIGVPGIDNLDMTPVAKNQMDYYRKLDESVQFCVDYLDKKANSYI